jgi:hypothetical protein
MNIPDHISESLKIIFRVKILQFFDADVDPGRKKFGSGIQDKHPGSATLVTPTRMMLPTRGSFST